jgi:hypothetical protein
LASDPSNPLIKDERKRLRDLRKALDLPLDGRPRTETWPPKGRQLARLRRTERRYIQHALRMFTETGHPFYAWRAYRDSRFGQLPIPEWVLQYFDDSANKLHALVHEATPEKGKIEAAIADAFGFVPKRGRNNRLHVFEDEGMQLAANVWSKLATGEYVKDDPVFHTIAQEQNVSKSKVRRAWEKYRSQFDLSITHYVPRTAKVKKRSAKI